MATRVARKISGIEKLLFPSKTQYADRMYVMKRTETYTIGCSHVNKIPFSQTLKYLLLKKKICRFNYMAG